jgi:hypothetical protein
MNLLDICEIHLTTISEEFAPWSRRKPSNYSADLLHRTPTTCEVPDPRYWTAYDCFIAQIEARREARRRAYRDVMTTVGNLAARWARMVRGRPAPRVRRAAT